MLNVVQPEGFLLRIIIIFFYFGQFYMLHDHSNQLFLFKKLEQLNKNLKAEIILNLHPQMQDQLKRSTNDEKQEQRDKRISVLSLF